MPPMPRTFVGWLRAQTHRDDPVGDLARDWRDDVRDGCAGRGTNTARGVRRHVEDAHYGADHGVQAAVVRAEREYLAEVTA